MLVTIIIGNHNYGRFIRQAIDSALAQTYAPIELIVVDDGSTDESRSIIDGYGSQVQKIYKSNAGLSSAINAGFAASRGSLICLLDSDDYYAPNKVDRVVRWYAEHPPAQFVFHSLETLTPEGTFGRPSPDHPLERMLDYRRAMRLFHAPPTTGVTFRREMLERLMPIPERVYMGADNYLKFCAMSLALGFYSPERLGVLRLHGANHGSMGMPLERRVIHDMGIAMGIHDRVPSLTRTVDRLMASAIARVWQLKRRDPRITAMMEEYFSSIPKRRQWGVRLSGATRYVKNAMPWRVPMPTA